MDLNLINGFPSSLVNLDILRRVIVHCRCRFRKKNGEVEIILSRQIDYVKIHCESQTRVCQNWNAIFDIVRVI